MSQHIIPSLPIKQINRISPSKYFSLQACILREVWATNNEITGLLPAAPIIKIGTVAHRILELVVKGVIRNEEDAIKLWNREISVIESTMTSNWIEKHLLPLSKVARHYEVKRQKCLMIVRNMLNGRGEFRGVGKSPSMEAEVWVESNNGKVAGKIDLVRQTSNGIEIVDYKTGVVLDIDNGEVKQEYQQQLKIYAALYSAKYGKWPERLIIATLENEEYEITFTKEECNDLIDSAYKMLDNVNMAIDAAVDCSEIANATPDNCKYCSFRPACKAYWDSRDMSGLWPIDCHGKLKEIKALNNGSLRVILNDGINNMVIRGLDPKRHIISEDDNAEMYFMNLSNDSVEGYFIENIMTTYYHK